MSGEGRGDEQRAMSFEVIPIQTGEPALGGFQSAILGVGGVVSWVVG